MTITPIRDRYEPITKNEVDWYNAIIEQPKNNTAQLVVAELVKRGIDPERAEALFEMSFHPGGPPATRLGMVIAQHSHMPTKILYRLVTEHVPDASIDDMIAELRVQAAAADDAADALEAYGNRLAE